MAIMKVIEILSNSNSSWEDATANAIKKAAKSVKNIKSGEHLHKCAEYQREILNKKLFDIRRHYGLRSDLSLATVPFVILSLL